MGARSTGRFEERKNMNTEAVLNVENWDLKYMHQCFLKHIEETKSLPQNIRDELFRHYSGLSNIDIRTKGVKRIGLLSLGLPENVVDEMCKPKELTKKERYELLAEHSERERRKLDKLNRERKAETRRKTEIECDDLSDLEPDFWDEAPDSSIANLRRIKEARDKEAALNNKASVMGD
jgi:hypothetical protein